MSARGPRPVGTTLRMLLVGAALLVGAGCGSTRITSTSRSGTQAVRDDEHRMLGVYHFRESRPVDFRPLVGWPVYLDTSNLSAVDKDWLTYRLREVMTGQGVQLVDDRQSAAVIVEAGAAVYATDSFNGFLGVPSVPFVGTLVGLPALTSPEVSIADKTEQFGVSRIALFARDAETGRMVWRSGTRLADSSYRIHNIAGVRRTSGTIDHPSDRYRKRRIRRLFGRMLGHERVIERRPAGHVIE